MDEVELVKVFQLQVLCNVCKRASDQLNSYGVCGKCWFDMRMVVEHYREYIEAVLKESGHD